MDERIGDLARIDISVMTEVGLRLVLSQVRIGISGTELWRAIRMWAPACHPNRPTKRSESKNLHLTICSSSHQTPNATRVCAGAIGVRWSRSTPVRMIFYSSLDVMRLPVNRKPPGWSTQFSPCKLHEEPSPVPARLFRPVRCNRRLSLCSATLPVESEAKE